MPNSAILAPVEGDDPCGVDLRWDPDFIKLNQDFEMAKSTGEEGSIVDGELTGGSQITLEDILNATEDLSAKSKDLRILTIHAEASWLAFGLGGFAESLEDMVVVMETWPGVDDGVWPRADEDDGDLSERSAPIAKLFGQMSLMANTVGWGSKQLEISERKEILVQLKGVFDVWSSRVGPVFAGDPPSCIDGWRALKKVVDDSGGADDVVAGEEGGAVQQGGGLPSGDAWDLVERAAELMAQQDRHSPALPVLRLLGTWRTLSIMDIADIMKVSGVSLEQLLESVKRQTEGPPQ